MSLPDSIVFLTVCMNPTLQKTLRFKKLMPGEVNRVLYHEFGAAGKGVLVTRVLSQLGKKAVHLTHLGGKLKEIFLELCAKDNLDLRWVEGGSIRFCYTLVADGEVTELVEEGAPVPPETGERLLERYRELLPLCGAVIVSGSKAGGYDDALVPEMTRLARESGKLIVLDLRGTDLVQSLPFGPDLVKPNLAEFAETFLPGLPALESGEARERIMAKAFELCAEYRTKIVLSRGEKPAWYFDGNIFGECPVEKVQAVNTTGSGDAFTAGIAAALAAGLPFAEAVAEGVHCGSRNTLFFRPGVIRPV